MCPLSHQEGCRPPPLFWFQAPPPEGHTPDESATSFRKSDTCSLALSRTWSFTSWMWPRTPSGAVAQQQHSAQRSSSVCVSVP